MATPAILRLEHTKKPNDYLILLKGARIRLVVRFVYILIALRFKYPDMRCGMGRLLFLSSQ